MISPAFALALVASLFVVSAQRAAPGDPGRVVIGYYADWTDAP